MRAHLHPPEPDRSGADRRRRLHVAAPAGAVRAAVLEREPGIAAGPVSRARARFYLSVSTKLAVALVAGAWVIFSVYMALPWILSARALRRRGGSIAIITLIAFVPGAMNAFIVTSLIVDKRPPRRRPHVYPGLTVLVAAYNEEASITETVMNVMESAYPARSR